MAGPFGGAALVGERLEDVSGDVRARRVGDRAEVAERELRREAALVVDVERAEAARLALHPEHPLEAAARRVGRVVPGAPQREDDHGRVVDVGVVLVRELEREAARGELGPAHRPVAARADLLRRKPLARADDRPVLRVDACVEQREHRQRRVPDRRLAGLEAAALVVLDREVVEAVDRPRENRVVERVAERMQRDDRPDPRRLDPAPGAVALLPLDDPALGRLQSLPSQQADRPPGIGVGRTVDEDEDLAPEIRRDRRGRGRPRAPRRSRNRPGARARAP